MIRIIKIIVRKPGYMPKDNHDKICVGDSYIFKELMGRLFKGIYNCHVRS